jgi:hypothetical protein
MPLYRANLMAILHGIDSLYLEGNIIYKNYIPGFANATVNIEEAQQPGNER